MLSNVIRGKILAGAATAPETAERIRKRLQARLALTGADLALLVDHGFGPEVRAMLERNDLLNVPSGVTPPSTPSAGPTEADFAD